MGGSGSQPALAEPQLLLGLFWDGEEAQAAAALPGASCSPWGLILRGPHRGEETGGTSGSQPPPQIWRAWSERGQDREWVLSVGAPRKEGGSWQGVRAGD